MAISTDFQKIFAGFKIRGMQHNASSVITASTDVLWEDMQGYDSFAAIAINAATSVGAFADFDIVTATSSTGANITSVLSHTGESSADAIDDYLVLEVGAADINSTDTDARYIGARVQGSSGLACTITYIKGGGPQFLNQTNDFTA